MQGACKMSKFRNVFQHETKNRSRRWQMCKVWLCSYCNIHIWHKILLPLFSKYCYLMIPSDIGQILDGCHSYWVFFDPLFWRISHQNFKALYAIFCIIQPRHVQNILLEYLSAAQFNALTDDVGLMTMNDDHVKLRKEIIQSCICVSLNLNVGQDRIMIFEPRSQALNPLHRKQKC